MRMKSRYATGAEVYVAFSGEAEHPEPREVIFAESAAIRLLRTFDHLGTPQSKESARNAILSQDQFLSEQREQRFAPCISNRTERAEERSPPSDRNLR